MVDDKEKSFIELTPGLRIFPEGPQPAGGDRLAVDLLHPPHDHAGVHGLNDDANTYSRFLRAGA